jgi:hypothetical protein
LSPPAPELSWDNIVDYAFLADFDILRCAMQDIREKAWANPTTRILPDKFFKLQRAREEIKRLNIEIRRVVTYIQDEERFLKDQESLLLDVKPELAHQIALYRREHGRSNSLHMQRFEKLAILPTFTGDLRSGTGITRAQADIATPPIEARVPTISVDPNNADDTSSESDNCNDDDSDDDDDDHIVEDITYTLFAISLDDNIQSVEDLAIN